MKRGVMGRAGVAGADMTLDGGVRIPEQCCFDGAGISVENGRADIIGTSIAIVAPADSIRDLGFFSFLVCSSRSSSVVSAALRFCEDGSDGLTSRRSTCLGAFRFKDVGDD